MRTVATNRQVWFRLTLLAGITAFVVIVYWPSFDSIVALWDTADHRHGMLVFPIAAFLTWRARDELASAPGSVDWRGLLCGTLLLIVWVAARLAGIQVVEHFVVLALIPATILTFVGWGVASKLLFPLMFLLFATPISDALVPHLMIVTADISAALLKLSGFPVYREGQYISLPGGEFVVADVCSGVRYLITGVMVVTLYGYLTYESVFKRLFLVTVTAVTLIVANGVRAYVVMAVASMSNMQYLGGRDHIYFGWLMFGIVMMLLMWIGTRYADFDDDKESDDSQHHISEMAPSAIPLIVALGLIMLAVTVKPLQADFGPVTALLVVFAALLIFVVLVARHRHVQGFGALAGAAPRITHNWKQGVTAITAILVLLWAPRYVTDIEESALETADPIPFDRINCPVEGQWNAPWTPHFEQAFRSESIEFQCVGSNINVFGASYASARQGSELISSSNRPVPSNWDRVSQTSVVAVKGDSNDGWSVNEVHVSAENYEALIWFWYEVDSRRSTSRARTKALQVIALARGRPAGGHIVVLETRISADAKEARHNLEWVAMSLGRVP